MFDAFFHVAQSDPGCDLIRTAGQSLTVVGDTHGCTFLVTAQVNCDTGRAGMAFNIGQRLLCDPVKGDLAVLIQPVAKHNGRELGLYPGAFPEIVGQSLQSRAEAQIVQHTRTQVSADATHLGDGGSKVVDPLAQRIACTILLSTFKFASRIVQRVAHPDKDLADPIMQLTRNATRALPLARRTRAGSAP